MMSVFLCDLVCIILHVGVGVLHLFVVREITSKVKEQGNIVHRYIYT